MTGRLLDVNILVSLLDSAHVHHRAAQIWFEATALSEGRATCPITENGFIRIVSNVNYPNLRLTPAMAAKSLALFKAGFTTSHHFWQGCISLADSSLIDLSILTGARQTTDAYLAGLAFHYGGRLVTLAGDHGWRHPLEGHTRRLGYSHRKDRHLTLASPLPLIRPAEPQPQAPQAHPALAQHRYPELETVCANLLALGNH